mmetsp:Transcript_27175/g.41089  ORF Transcript_27175/g.41089 Transcript_27175/m.41089 type:complete len:221 (+) Transcript_27175:147-809(+)
MAGDPAGAPARARAPTPSLVLHSRSHLFRSLPSLVPGPAIPAPSPSPRPSVFFALALGPPRLRPDDDSGPNPALDLLGPAAPRIQNQLQRQAQIRANRHRHLVHCHLVHCHCHRHCHPRPSCSSAANLPAPVALPRARPRRLGVSACLAPPRHRRRGGTPCLDPAPWAGTAETPCPVGQSFEPGPGQFVTSSSFCLNSRQALHPITEQCPVRFGWQRRYH